MNGKSKNYRDLESHNKKKHPEKPEANNMSTNVWGGILSK